MVARRSEIRYRLIVAAEQLFAHQGVEGTSLRQIAAAVGLANNSAVQYHFGSKVGLIDAIVRQRMSEMEPVRGALLDEAEANGRLGDARTLILILCRPHLGIVDQAGRHSYAHFLCQYLLRYRPPGIGWLPVTVVPDAPPNLLRVQTLIRERLFLLPDRVIARRLVTGIIMYLSVLINYDFLDPKDEAYEGLDEALGDTIEQILAAICLPFETNGDRTRLI